MGLLESFFGISSSSNDESSGQNEFAYGDSVMVRRNGKVGVIVSTEKNRYTVKLIDEEENEYYETFSANELDSY